MKRYSRWERVHEQPSPQFTPTHSKPGKLDSHPPPFSFWDNLLVGGAWKVKHPKPENLDESHHFSVFFQDIFCWKSMRGEEKDHYPPYERWKPKCRKCFRELRSISITGGVYLLLLEISQKCPKQVPGSNFLRVYPRGGQIEILC